MEGDVEITIASEPAPDEQPVIEIPLEVPQWQSAILEMQQQINSRLDSVLSEVQTNRQESIATIQALTEANAAMTEAALMSAAVVASSTLEASTPTEPEPEIVEEPEVPESVEVVNPEAETSPAEKPARPKRRTL